MADAFDKLRMMEDEMNKYCFRNIFCFTYIWTLKNNVLSRFEEEIGIPNYVDGTPGTQTYGQMNRHLLNSGSGYSNEHDSTNPYVESTLSLSSGKYKIDQIFTLILSLY